MTVDGGRSYQSLPEFGGAQWAGFTDPEVGYVITRDDTTQATHLWRTTDAGARWYLVSVA